MGLNELILNYRFKISFSKVEVSNIKDLNTISLREENHFIPPYQKKVPLTIVSLSFYGLHNKRANLNNRDVIAGTKG